MMNIKFKDGKPRMANMGKRLKPKNAEIIKHPDGTILYLMDCPNEAAAIDSLVLNSRFNKNKEDGKYLMYMYSEYILDMDDPDEKTFFMLMDDFGEWWKHIEEKLGTEDD